jgi:hypothetical protein
MKGNDFRFQMCRFQIFRFQIANEKLKKIVWKNYFRKSMTGNK